MSTTPLPDEIAALRPLIDGVEHLVARTGRAVQAQYVISDFFSGPTFVGIKNPSNDPDDEFVLAVEELRDTGSELFFSADLPTATILEVSATASGPTNVDWFANPGVDIVGGMIGNLRLRTRKVRTPPVVPLTSASAENDLAELRSLLAARGHQEGFAADKIAAAERKRGVTFPEELRVFFSHVRRGELVGDPDDESDAPYAEATGSLTSGTGKVGNVVSPTKRHLTPNTPPPQMPAATPEDVVQPLYATKHWVVFATDGGGNDYALDLAPGPQGRIGQVVQFDHEREEPPELVAHSLTDFLAGRWVEAPTTTTPRRGRTPDEQELQVGGYGTPVDLTPYLGSTTLQVLELDDRAPAPVTDWHHLTMLPAVHHLEADAKHWQAIVGAEAYPPSLATAAVTDSRDLTVAEHVAVANSLLAHHGRDRFTLHRWTAG